MARPGAGRGPGRRERRARRGPADRRRTHDLGNCASRERVGGHRAGAAEGTVDRRSHPAQDWPPVAATDPDAWQRALKQLDTSHRLLAADARELDDTKLEALVPGLDYSVAVLLHGIVEHGTYHGGQIALLKKT